MAESNEFANNLVRMRGDLEAIERQKLASFAMFSGDTAGREHPEPPPANRTHFQRDWHRITHCQAFRKLEFKTQVFMFGEGYETVRNRLTHTLEVSQITSSICRALGLNEDLGTAIALAHDLGHPPFGHAGEDILHKLVSSFNHNVHGLRILRSLETRYPDFPGLNLTLETLEGLEKHDTDYDSVAYHCFFRGQMPTLEAQVASVADAIAYRSHDVEDGLSSGVLNEAELDASGLELWRTIRERLSGIAGAARMSQLARHLIDIMVLDVLAETERRILSAGIVTVDDARRHRGVLVGMGNDLDKANSELGRFLYENFYKDFRVARMMAKGQGIIQRMFETFKGNAALLPTDAYSRYRDADDKRTGEPLRVIADYLASLTDRQAIDEYRKLFDVGPR
jgi:dGTPase